jgi:hypothetical protein
MYNSQMSMDHVHVPAAEFKDSKYHIRMPQNPKCHFPLNIVLFDGKWHFGFCGIWMFKTMVQSQTGTMAMNLLRNREISLCHGKRRQKYRNGSVPRKLKVPMYVISPQPIFLAVAIFCRRSPVLDRYMCVYTGNRFILHGQPCG